MIFEEVIRPNAVSYLSLSLRSGASFLRSAIATEIRYIYVEKYTNLGVKESGTNTVLDLIRCARCCYYRCQPGVVAVIDDLIQFFLRPGCAGLLAEIVQYQQFGAPDTFKELIVRNFTVRTKCGAQVIQKIRYHDK